MKTPYLEELTKLVIMIGLIMLNACVFGAKHKNINSWGYQLQGYEYPYDLSRIYSTKNKIWVIDYSKDGTEAGRFEPKVIEMLKKNNNIIIAYISIGEAEEVRYYFDKVPKDLIIEPNPHWPDNHRVKYWDKEWQSIFLKDTKKYGKGYFSKLIEAGFDGAYLDIVDAYIYYDEKEQKQKARQMIQFIQRISKFCKSKNEDFLIFPQNAPNIFRDAKVVKAYFDAIDGIGLEDVFFYGDKKEDNPLNIQKFVVKNMKQFVKRGKLILSVEYIHNKKNIKKYFGFAEKLKFIPLISDRDLSGKLIFPKTEE